MKYCAQKVICIGQTMTVQPEELWFFVNMMSKIILQPTGEKVD